MFHSCLTKHIISHDPNALPVSMLVFNYFKRENMSYHQNLHQQIIVIFKKWFVRVIDINTRGCRSPSELMSFMSTE